MKAFLAIVLMLLATSCNDARRISHARIVRTIENRRLESTIANHTAILNLSELKSHGDTPDRVIAGKAEVFDSQRLVAHWNIARALPREISAYPEYTLDTNRAFWQVNSEVRYNAYVVRFTYTRCRFVTLCKGTILSASETRGRFGPLTRSTKSVGI